MRCPASILREESTPLLLRGHIEVQRPVLIGKPFLVHTVLSTTAAARAVLLAIGHVVVSTSVVASTLSCTRGAVERVGIRWRPCLIRQVIPKLADLAICWDETTARGKIRPQPP